MRHEGQKAVQVYSVYLHIITFLLFGAVLQQLKWLLTVKPRRFTGGAEFRSDLALFEGGNLLDDLLGDLFGDFEDPFAALDVEDPFAALDDLAGDLLGTGDELDEDSNYGQWIGEYYERAHPWFTNVQFYDMLEMKAEGCKNKQLRYSRKYEFEAGYVRDDNRCYDWMTAFIDLYQYDRTARLPTGLGIVCVAVMAGFFFAQFSKVRALINAQANDDKSSVKSVFESGLVSLGVLSILVLVLMMVSLVPMTAVIAEAIFLFLFLGWERAATMVVVEWSG